MKILILLSCLIILIAAVAVIGVVILSGSADYHIEAMEEQRRREMAAAKNATRIQ